MPSVDTFESMLKQGTDNALLRYSLASALVNESRPADAIEHLQAALQFDPDYSAAWKLLGKCFAETVDYTNAKATYEKGIAVADAKGDKQAAKEMAVFLRKVIKKTDDL